MVPGVGEADASCAVSVLHLLGDAASMVRAPRAAWCLLKSATMFIRKTSLTLGALACSVLFSTACNDDASDDTIVEPSRESRIDNLADEACDRYADTGAGCPGYGTGSDHKYATEADCENDFRSKASDMWPADRCDNGRIDNSRYQTCIDRVKNFACSSGGQSILDAVSALSECNADQVCTDPSQ